MSRVRPSPVVTVVMPAFNSAAYIGEALASVQAQTLTNLEVLLVDDGSTDGTLAEASRFASAVDLIVVRQANAGPSAARNTAIRKARGRYCAFLDADDIMLPELLATQVAALDAHPQMGLVVTDVATFDERGTIHERRWAFSEAGTGDVLERLLLDNFVTTSAAMAPTERLVAAGLFSEDRRVAEDYELWLNLAVRWEVGIIDRPLVRYRYSEGSLSSGRLYSSLCALEVIEAFWRDHPEYKKKHPSVHRRSLARHLRNSGSAALAEGKRRAAFGYLLKSIGYDPAAPPAWKSLAKTLVTSLGSPDPK